MITASRCCRLPAGRGSRSRRPCSSAGTDGSGPDGRFVGMHTFGESGPAPEVYEYFGITSEHVAEIGRELIANLNGRS